MGTVVREARRQREGHSSWPTTPTLATCGAPRTAVWLRTLFGVAAFGDPFDRLHAELVQVLWFAAVHEPFVDNDRLVDPRTREMLLFRRLSTNLVGCRPVCSSIGQWRAGRPSRIGPARQFVGEASQVPPPIFIEAC